jgi:serine/threonine-protein kinase
MSPEQIRRPKTVDTRTDIWSLGSILYELLVREPPFSADSPLALLAAVVSDPLPSIRDKRPDVPVELEAVIAKCLEKKPENRYQTVAELADALGPFAPRSIASVSRISGILRSTSIRPVTTDKSPSSERTLQSPGTPITGDEKKTEEQVRVKIITPAPGARSDKNTNTDWEATPSMSLRSRRRAFVAAVVGTAIAVTAIVLWQRRPQASMEAAPDPSIAKLGRGAAAAAAPSVPALGAPSAAVAVASTPAAPVPSASAVASVPSTDALAAKAKNRTKPTGAALAVPAMVPAPAAAPAAPAAAKPAADPLDGRR